MLSAVDFVFLQFYFKKYNMIEDKNPQRTPLSELGEFGLISHLTKNFNIQNESTLTGIGDDAAVLDFNNKKIDYFHRFTH